MELLQILKALSDETRFHIISLLLEHAYCVRALSINLGISESAVSQHLKVLKEAGLVTGEKQSYYTRYKVNCNVLSDLADILKEMSRWKQTPVPEEECRRNRQGGFPDED